MPLKVNTGETISLIKWGKLYPLLNQQQILQARNLKCSDDYRKRVFDSQAKKKSHLFGYIFQAFFHFPWYFSQNEIVILKNFFSAKCVVVDIAKYPRKAFLPFF